MLGSQSTEVSPIRLPLPQQVKGVAFNQKAKNIHLLHGAGFANDPYGTTIADLVVNYEDGSSAVIEIESGKHVRDWFLPMSTKRGISGGDLVWVQPSSEVSYRDIGIYKLSWPNPEPDKRIKSFDYVSRMQRGASFLLGITLDP